MPKTAELPDDTTIAFSDGEGGFSKPIPIKTFNGFAATVAYKPGDDTPVDSDAKFWKADSPSFRCMADRLIASCFSFLSSTSICFMFRDKHTTNKGQAVWGKATKQIGPAKRASRLRRGDHHRVGHLDLDQSGEPAS